MKHTEHCRTFAVGPPDRDSEVMPRRYRAVVRDELSADVIDQFTGLPARWFAQPLVDIESDEATDLADLLNLLDRRRRMQHEASRGAL
jgi:hypothetical protein